MLQPPPGYSEVWTDERGRPIAWNPPRDEQLGHDQILARSKVRGYTQDKDSYMMYARPCVIVHIQRTDEGTTTYFYDGMPGYSEMPQSNAPRMVFVIVYYDELYLSIQKIRLVTENGVFQPILKGGLANEDIFTPQREDIAIERKINPEQRRKLINRRRFISSIIQQRRIIVFDALPPDVQDVLLIVPALVPFSPNSCLISGLIFKFHFKRLVNLKLDKK
jgi:hypothetical protein